MRTGDITPPNPSNILPSTPPTLLTQRQRQRQLRQPSQIPDVDFQRLGC